MALISTTDGAAPFAEIPDSLARTSVGDEVLVERIIGDVARTLCADRGMQVGDCVRVQYCEGSTVMVRNVKGRLVRIPSPYALFVRTSHIPEEFTTAVGPGRRTDPASSNTSPFVPPVGHRLRGKEFGGARALNRDGTDAAGRLPNLLIKFTDVWSPGRDSDPVVIIGQSESGSTRWIGTRRDRRRGRYWRN